MKVSQPAQYDDSETEAAKQNSVIIDLINCTCAFPAVTWQDVYCEKGLLNRILKMCELSVHIPIHFSG